MTSAPIRMGLIGAGRFGSTQARAMARIPEIGELYIADFDTDRARALASEIGAEAIDGTEILHHVDAVYVATSVASHAEHILAAVQADTPVFSEKPISLDAATTLEVIDAVRRSGVPSQVGFMRRFDTAYRAARQAVADGTLGQLRRLHLVMGNNPPSTAQYVATTGGIYKDCLIHDVDSLRFVTGHEVAEVFAYGVNRGADYFRELDDVDESAGVIRMDDDTLATFQVSQYNGAGYDIRLEASGTEDTLGVGYSTQTPLTSLEPGFSFGTGEVRYENYPRFAAAYTTEIQAFVRVVTEDAPSEATLEDSLEALYICEALSVSRREHRPVPINEIRHRSTTLSRHEQKGALT